MSKALSFAMLGMLRQVARGDYGGGPYQVGNTNRTADALEARGLITQADDQRQARKTYDTAWVLTDKGRGALL